MNNQSQKKNINDSKNKKKLNNTNNHYITMNQNQITLPVITEKEKNKPNNIDSVSPNITKSERPNSISSDKPDTTPTNPNNIIYNRTKFQSMSEISNLNEGSQSKEINTEENINTDEEDTEEFIVNNQTQSLNDKPPLDKKTYSKYEFSVTSLDRRLQEIKRKRKNIPRKMSISKNIFTKTESSNSPVVTSPYPIMNKIDDVTIMMNPTKLINEHLNEIQLRIIGHTKSALMYEKRDKIIGYPVTILSSFLSSSIMISITADEMTNQTIIKYISLVLAIISFILSISRDYLNYSRRFQSHDLSSKLYTTILRSVEVRLIKNHLTKDDRRDIFKDIVDQMSIIEQYETPIPEYLDRKIHQNHESLNNINL